jgi:hypothetical protein
MVICSCGLPAHCCQPAVARGFIYADLRSELSIHLAPQALFTQSSPVGDATATSFPLSKHTGGGDTAPTFSGRCVYLQFTWEVGLPPSPVEFSSHCHFYKLSCSWLLGVCRSSCILWSMCLFTVPWGIAFPPIFGAQGTPPSLLCVFFVVIAYYSVFFPLFSLGGCQSVQGAMLIWPTVVCESTACHFTHLVVCVFPSGLGAGIWQCRSPPGFSV